MIVQLNDYCYGKKVLIFSKTKSLKNSLVSKELPVMYIHNQKITIFPEVITMKITKDIETKFLKCNDYDVFFISETGWCYNYYSTERNDTAFMLTSKCNSNCIMCPATDKMRQEKDIILLDDILKIIELMPNDAKHITITGGEPFLVGKRIFEIFDAFKNKLPRSSFLLLTNGRIFSNVFFAEELARTIPPKTIIAIPIHGYDPTTHDCITRTPGSFEQTYKGLKNILKYNLKVELRIVVSNLNYEYVSRIARLIIKEFPNVFRVRIIAIEALGNAALNIDKVWIPYPDAFKSSKDAIDMLVENAIDVALYNFPLCAVDSKYHFICAKSITDYKVRYTDECEVCKYKSNCGGIFAGSIRLAKNDVKPVI